MDDLGSIQRDRDLTCDPVGRVVAPASRASAEKGVPGGVATLSPAILAALFDRIEAAAICLGVYGEVLLMNAAARRLVTAGDGLMLSHDRLEGMTEADTERLHRAIDRAMQLRSARRGGINVVVTLTGTEGDRVHPVEILPVPSCDRIDGRRVAVVLFVSDACAAMARAEALPPACRLTPAETRLAVALAAGRSLKEHAAAMRISVETARWYLKQIFAKTGTKRQVDLVRLLLSGGASMPTSAAAPERTARNRAARNRAA